MDTLDRVTPAAVGLLDGARRVRLLDDAIRAAREELDNLAGMIVRLHTGVPVPHEIDVQLDEIHARMNRLDRERDTLVASLA